MKAIRNCIFIGVLVAMNQVSFSQEIWTIGPMLHFGIGGEKKNNSFSVEAAYWNIYSFIYSVDFGLEFERNRIRLYSEAQTGIGVTGISLGPVVEFSTKGGNTRLGVQGSCWINYFVGFDYRIRYIGNEKLHYTGIYAKLPFATSGLDDGDGSSWDDWDDWD